MLHAFSGNPLFPAVLPDWRESLGVTDATNFVPCPGGLHRVGFDAEGFCFDNETPSHIVYLAPYSLASRLVRNRDWLDFVQDKGYQTPSPCFSAGSPTLHSQT